jgi:hypothetical protein
MNYLPRLALTSILSISASLEGRIYRCELLAPATSTFSFFLSFFLSFFFFGSTGLLFKELSVQERQPLTMGPLLIIALVSPFSLFHPK